MKEGITWKELIDSQAKKIDEQQVEISSLREQLDKVSRINSLAVIKIAELREEVERLKEELKESDVTLSAAFEVGEIRFKTCVLSSQVHNQIIKNRNLLRELIDRK